jgi:hypothetical protein
MNRNCTYVSTVLGTLLTFGGLAPGQEENPEPLELTRLREQFQARIDQEMIPWRDKYKKELQKLEDRLIAERRLKEAVAVKAERDYGTGLSSKPTDGVTAAGQKAPETPADAKKALAGTVWLVYAAEDKKHETLMDVYHFIDSNSVSVFTAKKAFAWSLKSLAEPVIQFPIGDIRINVNFSKSTASATCAGKEYNLILAGRPDIKGN